MHSAGYLGFAAAACVIAYAVLLPSAVYAIMKRSNFILQTRSPHILAFTCLSTMLLVLTWSAEEIRFAVDGESISPYLIACQSHFFLPFTIVPLLFRGEAFCIMFNVAMRKKYVRFIRRRAALAILALIALGVGGVAFLVHCFVAPDFFDTKKRQFGSNLFFGEWRWFLPLFVVCIILQLLQLRQLKARKLDDTLGIVAELKVILIAMVLFTATYFTWLICLEYGVRADSLSWSENRDWMRLNHLVVVLQLVIFGHVMLRQVVHVWQHTRHTLKVAALYDAQSKWMHKREGNVPGRIAKVTKPGRGRDREMTPTVERSPSGGTAGPSSQSRDRSPNHSYTAAWGKYSPKVSRHNSPQGSRTEGTVGEGVLFAHSPKLGLKTVHGHHNSDPAAPGSPKEQKEPRLKSLHDILAHPIGRELFHEFAARHLTLESCMFYDAVESFEHHPAWASLDLRPVYDLGCSMYTSFVSTGSEFEINIDSYIKRGLKKIFGPTSTLLEMGEAVARAKRKKKKAASDDTAAGTGTATGAAAALATTTPGGRFEAFLSLPAASRRELYRPAQDEVYSLLKVNLYLPFIATGEFQNLKRAFEKELEAYRTAKQNQAAAAAAAAVTPIPSSPGGEPLSPDGAGGKPQYLKTPSVNVRRAHLHPGPTGHSQSPSPQVSPTIGARSTIQLRMDASPNRSRRNSTSTLVDVSEHVPTLGLGLGMASATATSKMQQPHADRPRLAVHHAGETGSAPVSPSPSSSPDGAAYPAFNYARVSPSPEGSPASPSGVVTFHATPVTTEAHIPTSGVPESSPSLQLASPASFSAGEAAVSASASMPGLPAQASVDSHQGHHPSHGSMDSSVASMV